MEEIEIPTEHLHERIKETTEEQLGKGESKTILSIAVCTALMAVFAALAGLMAGDHSNEALIDQIRSSDQWAFYQAKSIKAEIRQINATATAGAAIVKSPEQAKKEEEEIKIAAEKFEKSSETHFKKHVWLARSVTLFQVAIAISAISIFTKKTFLWFVGLLISMVGLVFFIIGLV